MSIFGVWPGYQAPDYAVKIRGDEVFENALERPPADRWREQPETVVDEFKMALQEFDMHRTVEIRFLDSGFVVEHDRKERAFSSIEELVDFVAELARKKPAADLDGELSGDE